MRNIFTLFLFLALVFFSFRVTAGARPGFDPNFGQITDTKGNAHPEIMYKYQGDGVNLYFLDNKLIYHFIRTEDKKQADYTAADRENYKNGNLMAIGKKVYFYRLDLNFEGANQNVRIEPEEKSETYTNYYLPSCPNGITEVSRFGKITYRNIYQGIDLAFYFLYGKLKYDFIVHPGADIKQIKLRYDGASKLQKLASGEIIVSTPVTDLTEGAPVTYQAETRKLLPSSYILKGNTIGFDVPERINLDPLVIDPTVTWATYFNNGSSSDTWAAPAFDNTGGFAAAAYTYYTTFPVLNAGSGQYFDSSKDGITDLVIVRFANNYSLAWATYYGGNGGEYVAGFTDYGKALVIDDNNNIIFGGTTDGTVFPTQNPGNGAFYQDQTRIFSETSFLVKLNLGGVRQWATIFQHENANTSSGGFRINGLATNNNKIYFTGQTYRFNSNDIPIRTLTGAYNNSTWRGPQDVFLGRFSETNSLEWCTYFNDGGLVNASYRQGCDLTFDPSGNMWFVGRHTSNATNAGHYLLNAGNGAYYQGFNNGDQDLIITKFNSTLVPVHSTYYGGNDQDIPSNIAASSAGDVAIVLRAARSTNLPVYDPGGAYYQPVKAYISSFDSDAAIIKLNSAGQRQWATYYGGSGGPTLFSGVGFDASNNIYVFGSTQASNFPVQAETNSYNDASMGGSGDAVLLRFTNMGVRQWATFYGGSGLESLYSPKGVVRNSSCGVQLLTMPYSSSTNYPTVNPGGGAFYESTALTANVNTILLMEETNGSGVSVAAATASASNPSICQSGSTTLSVTGGSLGPGASWKWYTGSCGGSLVGTGASLTVSPTVTTTYYVRAEGDCNITSCKSVTVDVANLAASIQSQTSVSCLGGSNGSATIAVTGGTTPYSYVWSPSGGSAASASGLSAGTYTITISDATGCSAQTFVTITQPSSSLSAAITSETNASCSTGSDGSAIASPSGGTSPYTYSWLPSGGTGATGTGLGVGTYTVTVTDANGCTAQATASISGVTYGDATVFGNNEWIVYAWNAGGASNTGVSWNQSYAGFYTDSVLNMNTLSRWGNMGSPSDAPGYQGCVVNPDNHSWSAKRTGFTCGYYRIDIPDHDDHAQLLVDGVSVWEHNGCCDAHINVWSGILSTTSTIEYRVTEGGGASSGAILINPITLQENTYFCQGNSVSLNPASVTAYPYSWSTGGNNAPLSVNQPGTYVATATSAGCSVNYTFNVSESFSVQAIAAQPTICNGQSTALTALAEVFGNTSSNYLYSGFSDSYAPANWSISDGPGGSVNISSAPGSVTITSGNNDSSGNTDFIMASAPHSGTVLFNWSYSTTDGPQYDYPQILVNGSNTPLQGYNLSGSNNQSGTMMVSVAAGQNLTFRMHTTDGSFGPASLIISNFSVEVPITYIWSPATGLSATNSQTVTATPTATTTYTVTASNGNCTVTSPVTVTINIPSIAISTTDVSCYGGKNGTATASVTGTGPFIYSWSTTPVQTAATATGLAPGSYTVSVTDSLGCLGTETVVISQPAEAIFTTVTNQTIVSCFGGSDGAATVVATGGSGVYTYSWSTLPVQNTATASGLSAGNYQVLVSDGANCSVKDVSVSQNSQLSIPGPNTFTVSCNASQILNGAATGGAGGYSYLWSTGEISATVDVPAGNYQVQVTDQAGCSVSKSYTVTAAASSLSVTLNQPAPVCPGASVTLQAQSSGGFGGYTYQWSTGQTGSSVTVGAGNYCVKVTDAGGCLYQACVEVSEYAPINASASVLPILCAGGSGTATIISVGGQSPFTYLWSTGETTASVTKQAGTYTALVTDANGCTSTATATLTEPAALLASVSELTNSVCIPSGSASVAVSGGVAPYTYLWNTSPTQDSSIAINLAAGTYSVTISDANGCQVSESVSITSQVLNGNFTLNQAMPTSGTNFNNFAHLASALNTCGVVGPLTVNVVPGTGPYTGKLLLSAIPGSSATNTLTINGNGNTLTGCFGPFNGNRDMIRLDGTDHITINGFVLDGSACGDLWGVHLLNGNENVTISNNTILHNPAYSIYGANHQGIIAANSYTATGAMAGVLNNLTITGNTINHGYAAIRINGSSSDPANNVLISNNTLTGAALNGIVTSYTNNLAITGNQLNLRNVHPAQDIHSIGIQISNAENGLAVTGNKVANAGKQALFLNYVNEQSSTRGLIANNMLGGGMRFSSPIAMQLNYANYLDVYFNSLNADFGTGIGLYVSNVKSRNLRVMNNSIAYTGASATGRAMSASGGFVNFTQLNYNNYYSTGQFVWFNNALRNNLTQLRASMENGTITHDQQSTAANPQYVSATDLHLSASSFLQGMGTAINGIATDFDGQTRPSVPSIGADEYTAPPRMAQASEQMIIVYPNPFRSELSIELAGKGRVEVVLIDLLGREVFRSSFVANGLPITITPDRELAEGVYLLQVTQNNQTNLIKVVKQ